MNQNQPIPMMAGNQAQPERKPSPEQMKALRELANSTNFAQDYLDDMKAEAEFLSKLENKPSDEMKSEIDLMVMVYNEQLEGVVRLRFDIEIHDMLMHKEPNEAEHVINKAKSVKALERRRITVKVIRKQILELLKHGKTE